MRAFAVTLVVGLAWAGGVSTAAPQTPDPAKVKTGMELYATLKCSTCHLIGGVGNKRYPLDGVGAKLSVADLRMWITDSAAMEAKLKEPPRLKMSTSMKSKKLTDADVEALVAYMQSLR